MMMKPSGPCVIVGFAAVAAAGGCGVGGGMLSGTGGANGGSAGPMMTGSAGSSAACRDIARPAAKLPVSVMIALDTSASMNDAIDGSCTTGCMSKWAAAVQSINSVVDATTTEIPWGLTFMGGTANACDPTIGSLVGLNDSIRAALQTRTSGGALINAGNRATGAAVGLAAKYASSGAVPAGSVVLLVTDGSPECMAGTADARADDTASAVRAVSDAFASGVATFVVGLATSGGAADAALSEIANAGGFARAASPPYFPASSSADLVTAMNVLAASAACTFVIPPPMTSDGASSREYIRVSTDSNLSNDSATIPLDPANGWTYTDSTHTALRLHGSACEAVRNGTSTVYVLLYCH